MPARGAWTLSLFLTLCCANRVSAQVPCSLVLTPGGGYTLDCPTEAHPHLWRAATIAVGAVMFADAMTTAYAIGSGKGAELNPILAPLANHPTAFGLVKGGLSVSAILTVFKLHQDPAKRTQALSLLAIQGAVSSLAVISNQRHLSESRP